MLYICCYFESGLLLVSALFFNYKYLREPYTLLPVLVIIHTRAVFLLLVVFRAVCKEQLIKFCY